MKRVFLIFAIGSLMTLTGCGGGGTTATSATTPTPLVADFPLTATSMRLIQFGDSVSYTATLSSLGYPDGSGAYNLSGTLQGSYSSNSFSFIDPVSGQSIIPPVLEQIVLTVNGTPTIKSNYISQDSNASIFMLVEGSTAIVNFPVGRISIKSPLFVGQSWTESFFQNDATANTSYQINSSCAVTGTEIVQTGLGNFEAYKVSCNERATAQSILSFNKYYSINSVSWIHPPLGFVKSTVSRIDEQLGVPLPTKTTSLVISGTNVAF